MSTSIIANTFFNTSCMSGEIYQKLAKNDHFDPFLAFSRVFEVSKTYKRGPMWQNLVTIP